MHLKTIASFLCAFSLTASALPAPAPTDEAALAAERRAPVEKDIPVAEGWNFDICMKKRAEMQARAEAGHPPADDDLWNFKWTGCPPPPIKG
ncbi:hypothetical protein B0T14DRAFT_567779 [Immersiella caudata]|uniref:Uncharacterized protein n=1 Tax=Immersiella caudata TaxID=314043 RepID=A0AA39WIW2_9PEZI|nr:hypothetical protein B0T14DRAFT_567779 [Immersiella caudata]